MKRKTSEESAAKSKKTNTGASTLLSNGFDSLFKGNVSKSKFFEEYFEKKPLHIRQCNPKYCTPLSFSRQLLLDIVDKHDLGSSDMAVCRYVDQVRENCPELEDPDRTVDSTLLAKLFAENYSVQFYQPQRYADALFQLNSSFENTFGCLAGASAYLTPPGTQALAPHHDDVEVFILQMEGKKHWKVYNPIVELAGEHSNDLEPDQIGEPILELVMEEGDMLYLPRGYIHQAMADADSFSTHVTISVYQHNTWANFIEMAIPQMLRKAFDADVTFRSGLPVNYLSYMGTQYKYRSDTGRSDKQQEEQEDAFQAKLKEIMQKLINRMDKDTLHECADMAAVDFMTNRLPPVDLMEGKEAACEDKFRLKHRKYLRLTIQEEDGEMAVSLLHSVKNSRLNHLGAPEQPEEADEQEQEDDDDEDVQEEAEANEMMMEKAIPLPPAVLPVLLKLLNSDPAKFWTSSELMKESLVEEEEIVRGLLLILGDEQLLEHFI